MKTNQSKKRRVAAVKATVPAGTWVPHPANFTQFRIGTGNNWTYIEGDYTGKIPEGATRCKRDYTFLPGVFYRWTLPVPPALVPILKRLGRPTARYGPMSDPKTISGGSLLRDGTFNMQPNMDINEPSMAVTYERLEPTSVKAARQKR